MRRFDDALPRAENEEDADCFTGCVESMDVDNCQDEAEYNSLSEMGVSSLAAAAARIVKELVSLGGCRTLAISRSSNYAVRL
jgi:precorrin-4 methylase